MNSRDSRVGSTAFPGHFVTFSIGLCLNLLAESCVSPGSPSSCFKDLETGKVRFNSISMRGFEELDSWQTADHRKICKKAFSTSDSSEQTFGKGNLLNFVAFKSMLIIGSLLHFGLGSIIHGPTRLYTL